MGIRKVSEARADKLKRAAACRRGVPRWAALAGFNTWDDIFDGGTYEVTIDATDDESRNFSKAAYAAARHRGVSVSVAIIGPNRLMVGPK